MAGLKELKNITTHLAKEFQKGFESEKALQKQLNVTGNDIRNTIVKSMRNTPRASWSYPRGKNKHHPSKPENPPAIDTGELINRILFNTVPRKLEVGTPVKYGKYLEDPENSGLKRYWLMPAAKKHEGELIDKVTAIVVNDIVIKLKRSGVR